MKIIFITLGTISVILGVIGIFLPLLPTTPFLLLAATLYFHSSPKLYDRLLSNRYLGSYIRNFREHRTIPLHAKLVSVTLVWISIGYCILFVVSEVLWAKIALSLLAIGVSLHILSYASDKRE